MTHYPIGVKVDGMILSKSYRLLAVEATQQKKTL